MRKEELRLAVVIYGGASLAVYMHGVCKELHKLVQASKLCRDRVEPEPVEQPDTQHIYQEMMTEISTSRNFRVVIDVIAGASSGAINGSMLGKAIVDDLPVDAQTSLWLEKADVGYLGHQNVSRWRKWYLYPFLKWLSFWVPEDLAGDPETREKLEHLVRSSWFSPPFSGERLCHHFFNAFGDMSKAGTTGNGLLPFGQRLDFYASITDLLGHPRSIRLHDRLVASERQHGLFCRLSHVETEAGRENSDFADDNIPALVWAARASSSYAGAFQPFHHSEMKKVLSERGLSWSNEQKFLNMSLYGVDGSHIARTFDPADRYYVDGGIVNNKPFAAAMEALNHRSADRHVERCIVYVEPDPSLGEAEEFDLPLSYLTTIRRSASTIPRNQPILEELTAIVEQDFRVQTNRRIVESNDKNIRRLVADLLRDRAQLPLTRELLTGLRYGLLTRAADEMGLAFRAYVQRRVWRLTEALVDEWGVLSDGKNRALMTASVEHWWRGQHQDPDWAQQHLQDGFLDRFDVTFRIRRLQFVIRRLNQRDEEVTEDIADQLEAFKRVAYQHLAHLYRLRRAEQIDETLLVHLAAAATQVPLSYEAAQEVMKALSSSLDLHGFDRALDADFHAFCNSLPDEEIRQGFVSDYVGYAIYDVLLMSPGSENGGPDPLTPIRVERISPADSPSLQSVFKALKGRNLMAFAGFFNRSYREHDYLWGRLNAADRMVDLVCSAAEGAIADPDKYRMRLFYAILNIEGKQLKRASLEINRIRKELDGRNSGLK